MFLAPLILALIAFVPQDAPAGDVPKLKAAFEQAKMCSDATVNGEYEKLVELTHPAVVKLSGGKDKMLKQINDAMSKMKSEGMKFEDNKVEPAKSITKAKSSLYCILPTTVKMSVNGTNVTVNSFLLGVSTDDGKKWTFLDGNGGEEKLRKILPEIPKELKIPAVQKPVIEK